MKAYTVSMSCIECGYNLKGVFPDKGCPECGAPLPTPTTYSLAEIEAEIKDRLKRQSDDDLTIELDALIELWQKKGPGIDDIIDALSELYAQNKNKDKDEDEVD